MVWDCYSSYLSISPFLVVVRIASLSLNPQTIKKYSVRMGDGIFFYCSLSSGTVSNVCGSGSFATPCIFCRFSMCLSSAFISAR